LTLEKTENLSDEDFDYRAYLDYKPAYSPHQESDDDSPMEKRFIKDEENSDNVFFVIEDNPKHTYMDHFNIQPKQAVKEPT
jgi:hypothetical protein